jgi:DNA-directed RNA polymerase subunit alpha
MAHKNLLKNFKKPSNPTFEHDELNPHYGRFIAAPFERGFGATIANSLRRCLLSSIPGYAITSVKVEFVGENGQSSILTNEFENIYGVYEDSTDMIQNLKKIRIKLLDDADKRVILIEKKGKGELLAGDLAVDANIEIVNSDLHIADLNENTSFTMELEIEHGRGYMPSEQQIKSAENVHAIPIDAIFCPIEKVRFNIENFRVGQRTDYDKMVLEVWTDGTTSPDDAVADAAKILKDHFQNFINFEEVEPPQETPIDSIAIELNELRHKTIEDLELSVRSSNCLRVANIRFLGDLILRNEEELTKIRNLGAASLKEVRSKIEAELSKHKSLSEYSLDEIRTKIKELESKPELREAGMMSNSAE